jgi:hypothetical protein
MRRGIGPTLARARESHAADLAAGVATLTTYEATDALRVEEFEDEGSQYYLKLADGRVLFLAGQYLYEYELGEDEDGQVLSVDFEALRPRRAS